MLSSRPMCSVNVMPSASALCVNERLFFEASRCAKNVPFARSTCVFSFLVVCHQNTSVCLFTASAYLSCLKMFTTLSPAHDPSTMFGPLLSMNDLKGTQPAMAPPTNLSHGRHARVPNTRGFWTDLALARCAYRSSSVILTLTVKSIAILMYVSRLSSVRRVSMR